LADLVGLLESEHDSVEDLAEKVWLLIDSQRSSRDMFLVAVNHGGGLVIVYGLYVTENAAKKDLEKFRSTTGNERAYVLRLADPASMFDIEDSERFL